VPLDRAGTPGKRQPRFHRLVVVSQAVSKALKSRQTTLDRSLQPGLKPFRLALTYELRKTLAQIDGFGSLGVLLMELTEEVFVLSVSLFLAPHDQPGRTARCELGRFRLGHLGLWAAFHRGSRRQALRLT